jgi:hypothetical protein
MKRSVSGSCPVEDFDISGVKTLVLLPGSFQSRSSSVSEVARLRAKRLRFDFLYGQREDIFLFDIASRSALGPTQPPIQCLPGVLSSGVKRSEREANHSLPSGTLC